MKSYGTCNSRRTTRRWKPWVFVPWPLLFVIARQMNVLIIRTSKQTRMFVGRGQIHSNIFLELKRASKTKMKVIIIA